VPEQASNQVAAGNAETLAPDREAERIFNKARSGGAQASRILPYGLARRLHQCDAATREVLLILPMVGG
jgi:hypothetical protein